MEKVTELELSEDDEETIRSQLQDSKEALANGSTDDLQHDRIKLSGDVDLHISCFDRDDMKDTIELMLVVGYDLLPNDLEETPWEAEEIEELSTVINQIKEVTESETGFDSEHMLFEDGQNLSNGSIYQALLHFKD